MVGNTDLEAYVVDTQKEILTTQKASFEEIWLTGSDIIYDDYTGYDNKGSIWGFRLQNDFYVGTDIDPRTLQGIERDQVSEVHAAINQSAAIAAAAIDVDGIDSAFDKLNTSITSGKASEINAPFFIEVKGEKWVADFTKEQGPWFQKKDTDVEAGFVIEDPQDFVDIMTKKKNATALFMSGRLAVEGDMGLAMKVNVIFS